MELDVRLGYGPDTIASALQTLVRLQRLDLEVWWPIGAFLFGQLTELQHLTFTSSQMDPHVIDALSASLRTLTCLEELTLDCTSYDGFELTQVMRATRCLPALETLATHVSEFEELRGFEQLRGMDQLRRLDLRIRHRPLDCSVAHARAAVRDALNPRQNTVVTLEADSESEDEPEN